MGSQLSNTTRRALLVLCCILLAVGNCGGPLIMRLYFVHGGNRIWLSSFLQTAGCPIILVPLVISYIFRRKNQDPTSQTTTRLTFMNLPVFVGASIIGLLTGACNYLAAFGIGHLPVSTMTLILATQLAFVALFAFFLVRQKFTAYSINAIVLLMLGAGVLAIHAGNDRPPGESKKLYVLGFLLTLASSALYGLILPLIELTYKKAKQGMNYTLVLEVQMVLCLVATVFCTVGMIINNDFKVIPREAREFQLGETKYYMVLVWSGIIWQFFLFGATGIIFCASSLFSGVMITVLLPISQLLAVLIFHDKFQAEKGVSLALSLWGSVSYFYGEWKQIKKNARVQEPEMSQSYLPDVAP
ncbi:hypothetical protein ACH5RR_026954 [Cinchona calisaya]|uniref:Probable purine permease n=1 Tax=Cinchona calisaya TaxID=153742 RepID=A0ABD2Z791_9GENT